jgi:cytochrome c-type biogenesis protein CcmH/NrfG
MARVRKKRKRESSADATDALDDAFFASDGGAVALVEEAPLAVEPRVDDVRKWTPEARARRARFATYVRVAVGLCVALCVAAAGRNVLSAREQGDAPRRAAVAASAVAHAPAAIAPVVETAIEPATPLPEVSAVAAPSVDRDAAPRAKRAAQRALEMGRVAAAIESGETSVALDPSDGEAWLILGAAYLERGQASDARRCFRSCVAEARRGPKWECAAMLR